MRDMQKKCCTISRHRAQVPVHLRDKITGTETSRWLLCEVLQTYVELWEKHCTRGRETDNTSVQPCVSSLGLWWLCSHGSMSVAE